jgi:hypothetical protein
MGQYKYEPLISIITLTYNHENYIAECIESVLCQTYENWEMIIVDDASMDKTPYIVEQYAKKDNRIKFIRNEKTPYFIHFSEYFWEKFHKEILDKLDGKYIEFGKCVGVQAKLELAKLAILKGDFKTSGQLLKEIAECPYIEEIFPDIFKKKLKVVKFAHSLRMPFILKIALEFKRTTTEKKYAEYKPFFFFFFKDLKDID